MSVCASSTAAAPGANACRKTYCHHVYVCRLLGDWRLRKWKSKHDPCGCWCVRPGWGLFSLRPPQELSPSRTSIRPHYASTLGLCNSKALPSQKYSLSRLRPHRFVFFFSAWWMFCSLTLSPPTHSHAMYFSPAFVSLRTCKKLVNNPDPYAKESQFRTIVPPHPPMFSWWKCRPHIKTCLFCICPTFAWTPNHNPAGALWTVFLHPTYLLDICFKRRPN